MRDGVAVVVLVVAALLAAAGLGVTTTDLPLGAVPDATFEVSGLEDGTVTVEHAGGGSLGRGTVGILVYEDRPVLPDRTVLASAWGEEAPVRAGERIELEDPRFEPDQRVVVRWFGEDGRATLAEEPL